MPLRICLLVAGLVALTALGCGDGKGKVKSVPVKGVVNLDGKPLADGEVSFVLAGEAPVLIPVSAGAFSGNAFAGKNTVEVRSYRNGPPLTTDPTKTPTKVNVIPDRFSALSKLSADVSDGGANAFKFDVQSR